MSNQTKTQTTPVPEFWNIKPGDTAQFTRIRGDRTDVYTRTADADGSTAQWADLIESGYELTAITVFAGGIPNTRFVTWVGYDRNPRVAIQVGHPFNRVFSLDSQQMSASDLSVITRGHIVDVLAIVED